MKTGIEGPMIFPEISPDGRRIVYAGTEKGTQQLWGLENFLPALKEKKEK